MTVVIEQISPHHPKAKALLAAANAAMDSLYPPTSQHGLDQEEVEEGVFHDRLAERQSGRLRGDSALGEADRRN